MIVSLYIVLLVIGVLIFLKGMDDDAIGYMGISLIMFLLLSALAFYVTVPIADPATSTIVDHRYIEYGLVAICPMFCIFDLIFMILHFMNASKMKRGDIPYVPPAMR